MKTKFFIVAILAIVLCACNEHNTPSEDGGGTKQTQKTVDFEYKISGTDARRIKFINLSSSDLYNFTWDFGDSDTSDEKDPEKYYYKNGYYVVTLTAWGNNRQQKYVCEKTIHIHSDEPGLYSMIYIKGFKLYSIPSDGRYYKFSVTNESSWDNSKNKTIINTAYTEKLYSSDLPSTFMLQKPKQLNILWYMNDFDNLLVYVYQSTSTSNSGTQCLKQVFFDGFDFDFTYRDEYIVASDNGQTRIGVLMDWSEDY